MNHKIFLLLCVPILAACSHYEKFVVDYKTYAFTPHVGSRNETRSVLRTVAKTQKERLEAECPGFTLKTVNLSSGDNNSSAAEVRGLVGNGVGTWIFEDLIFSKSTSPRLSKAQTASGSGSPTTKFTGKGLFTKELQENRVILIDSSGAIRVPEGAVDWTRKETLKFAKEARLNIELIPNVLTFKVSDEGQGRVRIERPSFTMRADQVKLYAYPAEHLSSTLSYMTGRRRSSTKADEPLPLPHWVVELPFKRDIDPAYILCQALVPISEEGNQSKGYTFELNTNDPLYQIYRSTIPKNGLQVPSGEAISIPLEDIYNRVEKVRSFRIIDLSKVISQQILAIDFKSDKALQDAVVILGLELEANKLIHAWKRRQEKPTWVDTVASWLYLGPQDSGLDLARAVLAPVLELSAEKSAGNQKGVAVVKLDLAPPTNTVASAYLLARPKGEKAEFYLDAQGRKWPWHEDSRGVAYVKTKDNEVQLYAVDYTPGNKNPFTLFFDSRKESHRALLKNLSK